MTHLVNQSRTHHGLGIFGALTCLILLGAPASVFAQTYVPPTNQRLDINLDSGWRFVRQDVPAAEAAGFDDSSWTSLNLPHTWNNLDGQKSGEA